MKIRMMAMAVLMAGSLMLVGCGSGGSPESAVKGFMKALEKGDAGALTQLAPPEDLLATEFPEAALYRQAFGWIGEVQRMEGIKEWEVDFEIAEEDRFGDMAEVTIEVTYNKEEKYRDDEGEEKEREIERHFKFELIRYRGSWYVMDVNMNAPED